QQTSSGCRVGKGIQARAGLTALPYMRRSPQSGRALLPKPRRDRPPRRGGPTADALRDLVYVASNQVPLSFHRCLDYAILPNVNKVAVHLLSLISVLGQEWAFADLRTETNSNVKSPQAMASHSHTNRLAREKSPYLLQHQFNPVDWYAWGDEAFAKAQREHKPIFLSIGYSTCHWCHVMERESFESEDLARFLNEHFVSIKVDREERPDVDKIYMTFVQATTGQRGWPLNVFLTPDRKPFFGGTYFPPDNRYGRPSFLQTLQQVQNLWNTRRDDLTHSATEIQARLEAAASNSAPAEARFTPNLIRKAASL